MQALPNSLSVLVFNQPDCRGIAKPVQFTNYFTEYFLQPDFTISSFNLSRELGAKERLTLNLACMSTAFDATDYQGGTSDGCHNVDQQLILNCIIASG